MYEKLIDEYICRVTADMGSAQREEVGRELKSHIYDSAEAIAVKRGTGIDETIVREVLAKMMPPQKLAAMYPSKATFLKSNGMWKAVQALAGIAVAFLLLAGIIYVVAPEAAGISVGVILPVVSALALAIVVITIIFSIIYLYESRLKATYEARLHRLERSLEHPASPIKIGFTIFFTLLGMAVIALLWPHIPFIANFSTGQLVPLLTPAFGSFVPYYLGWGAAMVLVQVLYIALPQKWVASLLETGLSLASAMLTFWVFQAFPFNPELSVMIAAGIKVLLVVAILGTLIDAAKKLWQTAQFFIYGDLRNSQAG
ncbi:hypothetical protein [Methanocella sp. MCL-LM]|uniref:hypothetical protein n=1 Tax=Methanocella sp. MCL-LM TaxID=3412035 RepID=UPI003C73ED2B